MKKPMKRLRRNVWKKMAKELLV